MKIGIIGGGVVGRATARCFMEFAEVKVYDLLPERRTHQLPETTACDIVFVCLPTPQKEGSNECNLSYIEDFFEWHRGFQTNFILRSTVPIGTTKRLSHKYNIPNLVHSPEFLTARCAITDAQMPARNIIGTVYDQKYTRRKKYEEEKLVDPGEAHIDCDFSQSDQTYKLVDLYQKRFPGVPNYLMSSDESESVKLFQNSFFAVKVAFFNEINAICESFNLGWETVLEAMLADGRIGHSHTKVPGPDGKYGFGGTCLPKDLANLVECTRRNVNTEAFAYLCSAAQVRNMVSDRDRKVSE